MDRWINHDLTLQVVRVTEGVDVSDLVQWTIIPPVGGG